MSKHEITQVIAKLGPQDHASLLNIQSAIYRLTKDRLNISDTLKACIRYAYEKSSHDNSVEFLVEHTNKV